MPLNAPGETPGAMADSTNYQTQRRHSTQHADIAENGQRERAANFSEDEDHGGSVLSGSQTFTFQGLPLTLTV